MALLLAFAIAASTTHPCTGSQLSGSFAAVPGSAGAGNIVYALKVRNRSSRTCYVTGLPKVTLLGKNEKALSTHVRAAQQGVTAARIKLAPGQSAEATARFSPDVPGVGEQQLGQCEPTSYTLLVRPNGGGSLKATIKPATPVCEHGTLSFTVFRH
jgi:hypothetical protein